MIKEPFHVRSHRFGFIAHDTTGHTCLLPLKAAEREGQPSALLQGFVGGNAFCALLQGLFELYR